MAYLSRVFINPLRRQARRLLAEPQALHAAVLGGLPGQPVQERVLWRLDAPDDRRPELLVLTASRPSWEHLVEQAGWPSAYDPADPGGQVVTRPYEPLLEQLDAGRSFRFRLTANPTQSTKRPEKLTPGQAGRSSGGELARSVRLGHRTAEHQLSWFTARAERWGFVLPDSSATEALDRGEGGGRIGVVPDVRITARERRSFARGGGRVTLQVVTYEGRMVVADPSILRERLLAGFGPAKAYGCGLMTLAPWAEPEG